MKERMRSIPWYNGYRVSLGVTEEDILFVLISFAYLYEGMDDELRGIEIKDIITGDKTMLYYINTLLLLLGLIIYIFIS